MIEVKTCEVLLAHLNDHVHDGTTVAQSLFPDGRLSYPGRWLVEQQLGELEPYTIEHEARVVLGFETRVSAAVRILCRGVVERHTGMDPTMDLLQSTHGSVVGSQGFSLHRLVVAMVGLEEVARGLASDPLEIDAAKVFVTAMSEAGFPPSVNSVEELCDHAEPAICGLGLVEL